MMRSFAVQNALPIQLFFWIALGLVCFRIYLKLMTGWCRSQVCLVGKTALVTGANTGIGYETALDFAKRGATVILACRDESKARKARDNIIEETNNKNVSYGLVDFLDLASVRKFADEFNSTHTRLDILVNNAAAVRLRGVTTDGYLAAVQVNYLGPFLLTMLLLNLIVKTPSARIVNVSSSAPNYSNPLDMDLMFDGPDRTKAYYRSKFGNILFTIELASRLANTTVTVYSLHPGVVDTDIFRRLPPSWKFVMDYIVRWFMKTSLEGAQTTIYCALQKGIESYSGEHFEDCHFVSRYAPVAKSVDQGTHKLLWDKSVKLLGLDVTI